MPTEADSIDQASSARRERLRALRSAQELSAPSEVCPTQNQQIEVAATEDDSIQQAAVARRERLKALREAKELLTTPDGDSTKKDDNGPEENEGLKFRNYLPHDKQLQVGKLAPAVLPKFEDPVADVPVMAENVEDPFVNIAPKKPNWDLRRDVEKRLNKLEKRTQKAIYQLQQEMESEVENGNEKE